MTPPDVDSAGTRLLTASRVRVLAEQLGIRPTKTLGQNFVIDPGTVRKIVRTAGVQPGETVVEVGPGLGSLTLGLLGAGAHVLAVEIDPVLAGALRDTVTDQAPAAADRLTVIAADALTVGELPDEPTRLVANLPYNVAVPVLLTFLEQQPSLQEVLVMVQAEVADRLAAPPGSRTYGVPSAKAAWYAAARRAGTISRHIFWPEPNVDSALVRLVRRNPPPSTASREEVFACVDAAFAQRRKTLRAALATWAGSPQQAEHLLRAAGIDPASRGERLDITQFAALASARTTVAGTSSHPAGPR